MCNMARKGYAFRLIYPSSASKPSISQSRSVTPLNGHPQSGHMWPLKIRPYESTGLVVNFGVSLKIPSFGIGAQSDKSINEMAPSLFICFEPDSCHSEL